MALHGKIAPKRCGARPGRTGVVRCESRSWPFLTHSQVPGRVFSDPQKREMFMCRKNQDCPSILKRYGVFSLLNLIPLSLLRNRNLSSYSFIQISLSSPFVAGYESCFDTTQACCRPASNTTQSRRLPATITT